MGIFSRSRTTRYGGSPIDAITDADRDLDNPARSRQSHSGSAKETIVRLFAPYNVPSHNPAIGGYDQLLPGSIDPVHMCGGKPGLNIVANGRTLARSEDYQVGLYPVHAGDELQLVTSGKPDHRQRFDRDGIVIDLRVSGEPATLAQRLAATPGIGCSLGVQHLSGAWRQQGARSVFQVTSARLKTVTLTAGEHKDPGTRVWVIQL